MKSLHNKGIEMLDYPIWILRFVFLAILIIAVGFMVTKYINVKVDVAAVESAIMLQRILVSNSVMHQDEITLRTNPAIVESKNLENADKMLSDDLDFGANKQHLAARITLDNKKSVVYLNKRLFDDLKEQIGTIFGSDIKETKQSYKTFVRDGEILKDDILTVQVVQQKW